MRRALGLNEPEHAVDLLKVAGGDGDKAIYLPLKGQSGLVPRHPATTDRILAGPKVEASETLTAQKTVHLGQRFGRK
jgi:hypothetical protein